MADESKQARVSEDGDQTTISSGEVDLQKEMYNSSAIDPVLAKKMALINSGIDEIGMVNAALAKISDQDMDSLYAHL